MPQPLCAICGNDLPGAMKETDDERWAHLVCALWMPETCVERAETMDPVLRVDGIDHRRRELKCVRWWRRRV